VVDQHFKIVDFLNPLNAELNPIKGLYYYKYMINLTMALFVCRNVGVSFFVTGNKCEINPLNAELNHICHLLALLGGATIVVVSRLRVNYYPQIH
jgi:hypothetical protein